MVRVEYTKRVESVELRCVANGQDRLWLSASDILPPEFLKGSESPDVTVWVNAPDSVVVTCTELRRFCEATLQMLDERRR